MTQLPHSDSSYEEEIFTFFRNSLQRNTLFHSYLLVGPDFQNLEAIVKKITGILLCSSSRQLPCGVCEACRKIKDGIHADIITKAPAKGKKNLAIADIREVSEEAALKPWEGKYKIFILHAVHRIGIEAANALLKILEEPPFHTIFLLTAENLHRIPNTILSRCQIFRCGNFSPAHTRDLLMQKLKISEEKAGIAAILSGGNVLLAEEILEKYWDMRKELAQIFLQNQDPIKSGETMNQFVGSGEEGRQQSLVLLNYLCSFIRDLLIINMGFPQQIMNRDYINILSNSASQYSESQLYAFLQFVLSTRRMIESNVNLSLVWENIAMFLNKIRLLP